MTPTAQKLPRCFIIFFALALAAMVVETHQYAHAQDAGSKDPNAAEKPAPTPAPEPASAEKAEADSGDKKPTPAAKKPAKGIDAARKRMEKGQSLFSQGRYQEAMLEFEAAYDAMPFGAFLYNAAFAAEKAGDRQRAIAHYREFLASDPSSPDADKIKATIKRLQEELSNLPPPGTATGGAGGAEPSDGGQAGGGKPAKVPTAPVPADEATMAGIRSLVLVESEPPGAPLVIYERVVATAAPFDSKGKNPGWRKVVSDAKTPHDSSLRVGHYQIVIEGFQDYKRSETHLNLAPGYVYAFKANLSQGEFLAFLRIKSNVEGAKVFLDDPPPHKSAPWTRTPRGGQVNQGEHKIWVEAPGYKVFTQKVVTPHGQTIEVDAKMERVDYGYLVVDGDAARIDIEVDEKPYKSFNKVAGPIKVKLPAGEHLVVLDADGRKELEQQIVVPFGQELPVHATMAESYPRGKAIALGIIGTAAGVGGVFLHLEAEKPEDNPHDADALKIFGIGRYVAWGFGGLLVGLSVFYSIYDPNPDSLLKLDDPVEFPEDEGKKASKPKAKAKPKPKKSAIVRPFVAPIAGPDIGGLVIGGAF